MPRYDVEVFFSRSFVVDAENQGQAEAAAFEQAQAKFIQSGLETDAIEWDYNEWAYRPDEQPDIILTPEALIAPEDVVRSA